MLFWCDKKKTASLLNGAGLLGEALESEPYQKALEPYLLKSAKARELIAKVTSDKLKIRILFLKGQPEASGLLVFNWVFDAQFPDGPAILCNTDCRPYNLNGTTLLKWFVPWELILLHEFGHAAQWIDYGEAKYEQMSEQVKDANTGSSYAGDIEHDNLHKWEWPICDQVNYPRRTSYGCFCFKEKFLELRNKTGKVTPAMTNWAKLAQLGREKKTLV